MGMVVTHDMADNGGAFDGGFHRAVALVIHIEGDASLDRFLAISRIRNRAVGDHFFGVAVKGVD